MTEREGPSVGLPRIVRTGDAPDDFTPLDRGVVETSIADAIAAQVAARPDAEAVRAEGRTLSYAELDERSAALADALVDRIDRGAPVPFLADHDETAVVALVGALRAGGIATPLDPLAPAEAQRAILAQSGAPLLVTTAAKRSAAEATGAELVVLDELGPPAGRALPRLGPDDLATMLYTSGSTGEPKGVFATHRCELHTQRTMVDTLPYAPSDRTGVVMPLGYRFAIEFTLAALISGATVSFYDLRTAGFPGLPAWLAQEEITILPLVPTILRGLASGPPGRPFPSVRSVMVAGERADPSDVEAAWRIFAPDVEVAHTLASTEAQLVAWHFLQPGDEIASPVPAGRPTDDKHLTVVDADDRPVPAGELGELVVRSRYLTEGYWRQPEATDVVYSPPEADGERSYRTGDLASVGADGLLVVAGRDDDMVKVRGHRVALGEVEAALLELDAVEAAVVVQQDQDGRGALAAHVVLAPDRGQTTTADLRTALEEVLPEHKVPSVIVLLGRLPTLPNGKVDRRALPVVDLRAGRARALPDEEPAAPADELEKDLVRIWETVLELSPITVDDDFFAISDTSLDAASMVVAIEEELGVDLPVSVLLRSSTIRALAAEIRSLQADEQPAEAAGLVRVSTGTSGPRLLLCPDLSGSPFRFHPLAEALGADAQILGFESPLFTGPGRDVRTLDGLAAHDVAEAVEADPDGPYHVIGWSIGGVVAFEMARQLRAAGRPVGAVIVVDAGPHLVSKSYPRFSRQRRRSSRTPRPVAPESTRQGDGPLLRAAEAVLPQALVDEVVWRRDLRKHGQVRAGRRLPFVWKTNWRAIRDHRFSPYDGDVEFITSRPPGDPDPTSGLDRYVNGTVHLHHVVGEHELLVVDPLVDGVADAVRAALRRQA